MPCVVRELFDEVGEVRVGCEEYTQLLEASRTDETNVDVAVESYPSSFTEGTRRTGDRGEGSSGSVGYNYVHDVLRKGPYYRDSRNRWSLGDPSS